MCRNRITNLRDGVFDHLLVCHITLVADEQLVDSLRGVAVDLLKPLLDVVEAVHVRDVIYYTNPMGTAVIR